MNTEDDTSNGEVKQKRIKLDYSIEDPNERIKLVDEIIAQGGKLTDKYLEALSDYIVFAQSKEEKKKKKILTPNRMATIKKREISYQGLVSKFEDGEDGVQKILRQPDKNVILTPKISITQKDLDTIPFLRELRLAIDKIVEEGKEVTGKRKYALKKQEIEMRQDQYIIKDDFNKPIRSNNLTKPIEKTLVLDESIWLNKDQEPISSGILTLFDKKKVSLLLCNYVRIKEDSWGNFSSDSYYLMEDLDHLIDIAVKEKYPVYYNILIDKIDKKTNKQIQEDLKEKHGIYHSIEYISCLWRNKIPKIIAEKAKEEYLIWYYTEVEKGQWKKCSRCSQIKLANNRFFSRNSSSKDGFYSICKECRNKKIKKGE